MARWEWNCTPKTSSRSARRHKNCDWCAHPRKPTSVFSATNSNGASASLVVWRLQLFRVPHPSPYSTEGGTSFGAIDSNRANTRARRAPGPETGFSPRFPFSVPNLFPADEIRQRLATPNQAEPVSFHQYLRRPRARVVVRTLNEAISPCAPQHQQIAGFYRSKRPILNKAVARFANRSHDIDASFHSVTASLRPLRRRDRMGRVIERRADEIVHGRVHNHESLAAI